MFLPSWKADYIRSEFTSLRQQKYYVFKESFMYLHVCDVFGSLDKYQVTARGTGIQAFIRKPRHQNCTVTWIYSKDYSESKCSGKICFKVMAKDFKPVSR